MIPAGSEIVPSTKSRRIMQISEEPLSKCIFNYSLEIWQWYLWKSVLAGGGGGRVGAWIAWVDNVGQVLLEVAARAVVHQDCATRAKSLSTTAWGIESGLQTILIVKGWPIMIPALALHSEPERQTPVVSRPPTLTTQASWGKFTTWIGFSRRPLFFSRAVFPRTPKWRETDPKKKARSILTGDGCLARGDTDTVFPQIKWSGGVWPVSWTVFGHQASAVGHTTFTMHYIAGGRYWIVRKSVWFPI